jgi:hypothetical protein
MLRHVAVAGDAATGGGLILPLAWDGWSPVKARSEINIEIAQILWEQGTVRMKLRRLRPRTHNLPTVPLTIPSRHRAISFSVAV